MKALRIPMALMVLAALAVGCSEQRTPTESTETFTKPAFNFANGPDEAGIVVRTSIAGATEFFVADFDRMLLGVHDSDNSPLDCFGTPTEWTTLDIQDVLVSDATKELLLTRDYVNVYEWTGFPTIDCTLINDPTRHLAQGRVQFVLLDNDLNGPPPGANSWGFRSAGSLDNLMDGGKKVGYKLIRKWLWRPKDDVTEVQLLVRDGPRLNPDPR